MPRRKVAVVTGSRAEYGLLYWVLHDLRAADDVELQLIVTGMHLAPEFGLTVREIERDGFAIARRVEMLLSSDTPSGVAKSIGLGVMGMSDALMQLQPDVVLVLGDRFEILAAAQACLVHNIPLAHIAGGDTTEGAFDESIRHAITKMAHLHFVTNELSARRVRQLGEDPARVLLVGNPALDHLRRSPRLERAALEASLGAPLLARNLLITFHPVTLEPGGSERQLEALLSALQDLPANIGLWFTRPNADTGGRALGALLEDWVGRHAERARVFASLGAQRYLSLMAQVDAVVGNSSSGLCEAPFFGIPTVDIGDRQRGRLAPSSVLHCQPVREDIARALHQALTQRPGPIDNPYGEGRAAQQIVAALRQLPPHAQLLKKHFHLHGDALA